MIGTVAGGGVWGLKEASDGEAEDARFLLKPRATDLAYLARAYVTDRDHFVADHDTKVQVVPIGEVKCSQARDCLLDRARACSSNIYLRTSTTFLCLGVASLAKSRAY